MQIDLATRTKTFSPAFSNIPITLYYLYWTAVEFKDVCLYQLC